MKYELIATATFGLEAVVKREVQNLGYKILKTEDGKITYLGDERAIVASNLWLRSADRVLLKMGEFKASTFEELYQQIKGLDWQDLLPVDANFIVTGVSVKSTLHSVPACQKIVKKAIVDKLRESYFTDEITETGAEYVIKFTLLKDNVIVTVDTSGAGLHKRGYRVENVKAPIKETLAAAMVQLSFWKAGRVLVDPCCGSGTIAIEAALIGRNIAPGLNRNFAFENWDIIDKSLIKEEKTKAFNLIDNDVQLEIYAYDKDRKAIFAAKENALEAGVDDSIKFRIQGVNKLEPIVDDGIIITNPPYGERIGDKKDLEDIYSSYRSFFRNNPNWSLFMITPDKTVEESIFGREANRRRKLYNGRIEVCFYQFHGEKKVQVK